MQLSTLVGTRQTQKLTSDSARSMGESGTPAIGLESFQSATIGEICFLLHRTLSSFPPVLSLPCLSVPDAPLAVGSSDSCIDLAEASLSLR